jgi:hypothetical protein
MTITTRRTTIEAMWRSHIYLKFGRTEVYLDLTSDPPDRRFSVGRGPKKQ